MPAKRHGMSGDTREILTLFGGLEVDSCGAFADQPVESLGRTRYNGDPFLQGPDRTPSFGSDPIYRQSAGSTEDR